MNHAAGVAAGLKPNDLDGAVVFSVGAVDGEADLLAAQLGDLLGEGEGGHRSGAVDEVTIRHRRRIIPPLGGLFTIRHTPADPVASVTVEPTAVIPCRLS